MSAIEFEEEAYRWFKKTHDEGVVLKGGENSHISDIYSPFLKSWIEVKYLINNGARCGQFTSTTIQNNPYSKKLITNPSDQNLFDFIRYHYNEKEVGYFLVKDSEGIWFGNLEEFLERYSFSIAKPYQKRNGTKIPSKKYWNILQKYFCNMGFFIENNRTYINNKSKKNTYYEIEGMPFYINKNLEIRQQSKNYSKTWHIEVRE